MKVVGNVHREPEARGSKSERDAVVVIFDDTRYVLRRIGGPAFADPTTDKLVGQRVAFEGERQGQYFFYHKAKVLSAEAA